MRIKVSITVAIIFFFASDTLYGQSSIDVPMDEGSWNIESNEYKFEEYNGVSCVHLPQGAMELKQVVFHNGTIEFDMTFPEERGFPGILFRAQDGGNHEEFYIRPHQSGNPDANQYTPVFNGIAGWQLYYGKGHSGQIKYRFNEWHHIKLVIRGTRGEVFIDDMDQPLFQIHELKRGDSEGAIYLRGSANVRYGNFSYTQDESPEFVLPPVELSEPDQNTVTTFQVSEAVHDSLIFGQKQIDHDQFSDALWTLLKVEHTGTLNIARVARKSEKKNTALVKMKVSSDTEQVKALDIGYSDIAHVFVNGQIVYSGQRVFRSRDYRYLGTIGHFDTIYLNLTKGDNEVIFAISENFGGWGLKAQMENMDGISVD